MCSIVGLCTAYPFWRQLDKSILRSGHFLSDPRHSSMRPSVHFGSTVGFFRCQCVCSMSDSNLRHAQSVCPYTGREKDVSLLHTEKKSIIIDIIGSCPRTHPIPRAFCWVIPLVPPFVVTTFCCPLDPLESTHGPHCCSLSLAIFSSAIFRSVQ